MYPRFTGFVIRRANFGEADRIVTIFSKERGKVRTLAKGVRKVNSRRGPHLELFNLVKLSCYRGKSFLYLTEARTLRNFTLLREDLNKVAAAYQMCELVGRISAEEQENEEIYNLLQKGFTYLNGLNGELTQGHLTEVGKRFTSRVLSLSGFIAHDARIDPEDYVQTVLERRLKTREFISEIV